MADPDPTTDPRLRSWVPGADGSGFAIQHLPYGVFSEQGGDPRVGVAIGDAVCDLAALARGGLLAEVAADPVGLFSAPALDGFLAAGRATWQAVRARVQELLADGTEERAPDTALVPRDEARMHPPFTVADYVDFYSSIEHATNVGRMFRPDSEPLLPNWRHLPVGYHGRSGTVVASGTPVRRPLGQRRPEGVGEAPPFGPSMRLDFELEVGFVTGSSTQLGVPVPASRAEEFIFGIMLVNDWSARDIQAWEYQPLGPFLGKSFATSVACWVTPLAALAPFRVPQARQEPEPLPYLQVAGDWALDIELEVGLRTAAMVRQGHDYAVISRTNFRGMYWSMPQQLAHATVNGATIRPGDLYASGTVSGPDRGSEGSLLELTRAGNEPLRLPDGSARAFLEDGDEVVLRGFAGGRDRPGLALAECVGRIEPALEPSATQ